MSNKTRDKLIDIILINSTVPNVIQEKPYTAIEMCYVFDYKTFEAKGFSKVKYPDEWDEDFGYNLACLKAAAKIVKEVSQDKKLLKSIIQDREVFLEETKSE